MNVDSAVVARTKKPSEEDVIEVRGRETGILLVQENEPSDRALKTT